MDFGDRPVRVIDAFIFVTTCVSRWASNFHKKMSMHPRSRCLRKIFTNVGVNSWWRLEMFYVDLKRQNLEKKVLWFLGKQKLSR